LGGPFVRRPPAFFLQLTRAIVRQRYKGRSSPSACPEEALRNSLYTTYLGLTKSPYNITGRLNMNDSNKGERRGRPAKLTNQQILDAACAIGLPDLTLGGVAKALGASVAALYHYFKDRDELAEFVANTIIEDYPLPPDGTEDWFHWAHTFAYSQRALFESFPGLAQVAVQRTINAAIPRLEQSVRLARKSGFDEKTAWWATRAIQEFVFSWYNRVEIREALTARTGESYQTSLKRIVQKFPQEEMPLMRSITMKPQEESEDERFEFNLRALLAGIAAMRTASPVRMTDKESVVTGRTPRKRRAIQ
jgi:AcrR family transcriptional regulator